jgi:hypothetical protein
VLKRYLKFILFVLFWACPESFASSDSTAILSPLQFSPGVDTTLHPVLQSALEVSLQSESPYPLVERAKLALILQEQALQQTGICEDIGCAAESGKILGARFMYLAKATYIQGVYSLQISLVDVTTSEILATVLETCEGSVEEFAQKSIPGAILRLHGKPSPNASSGVSLRKGEAALLVRTNPGGARVYLDGKLMDGLTPLSLTQVMEGNHELLVSKAIDGIPWQAKVQVQAKALQVERLALALLPAKTILQFTSSPPDAEIYWGTQVKAGDAPLAKTPAILTDLKAGLCTLSVFLPGYKDTTLRIPIEESRLNRINLTLTEEQDFFKLSEQKSFLHQRSKIAASRIFAWTAGTVAGASAVFLGLAYSDYQDALTADKRLQTAVVDPAAIQADLDLRHERTDRGQLRERTGIILSLATLALAAVCITLRF